MFFLRSDRFKNEYKLQVKQTAKPCFPVEYLLVTVRALFPSPLRRTFTDASPLLLTDTPAHARFPSLTLSPVPFLLLPHRPPGRALD